MIERLNIKQFREIKEKLGSVLNEFPGLKTGRLSQNDEVDALEKYLSIQNELLSYDLSEISFEEWQDLELISDMRTNSFIDLSKTKANIDFSIVKYSNNINFKGCNILNFKQIGRVVNSSQFDEELVEQNKEFFISNLFNSLQKQKIYDCKLQISDLYSFTYEQLNELKDKKIVDNFEPDTRLIIKTIGFESAIAFYKYSNEDYYDIYLVGERLSETVKKRLYTRSLTFDDVIFNIRILKKLPILFFVNRIEKDALDLIKLSDVIGYDNLVDLIEMDPKKLTFIIKGGLTENFIDTFVSYKGEKNNKIWNFKSNDLNIVIEPQKKIFKVLNKFFKDYKVLTKSLLAELEWFTFKNRQGVFFQILNINDVKKFELETGFFSYIVGNLSNRLEMIDLFMDTFFEYDTERTKYRLLNFDIDFKDGLLNYEDFKREFVKCLDVMRAQGKFKNIDIYDLFQENFRVKYPDLFLDENAPEELKQYYYKGKIDFNVLCEHEEYIPYLIDKKVSNVLNLYISLHKKLGPGYYQSGDFGQEYISRYGNEKFFKLITKYKGALKHISSVEVSLLDMEDEKLFEKVLRKSIYEVCSTFNYEYLLNVPEFVVEYPDIFVNFDALSSIPHDEKEYIKGIIYDKKEIPIDKFRKYPEIIECFENKNLEIIFSNSLSSEDLLLEKVYGTRKFFELYLKYGRYITGIVSTLIKQKRIEIRDNNFVDMKEQEKVISFKDVIKIIEETIIIRCRYGKFLYNPDDAPSFLKVQCPELFLDDDAPKELKKYFYGVSFGKYHNLNFSNLEENKKALQPYLKGKSIFPSLLRFDSNDKIKKFLDVFGEEKATKLIFNKGKTVEKMIEVDKVELMKSWYDKTGGKFVPDFVVMQNFDINEADKFLTSSANWSRLMKIEEFAKSSETKEAIIKIAYSFGVFDQDQKGMKELLDLLTLIPQTISFEKGNIIDEINIDINNELNNQIKTNYENYSTSSIYNLFESLKKEGLNIDLSKDIFMQLYRKNNDGSYTLTFDQQRYPKTVSAIRKILSKYDEMNLITPEIAHQMFGGFYMQYDPDFREFFLKNLNKVLSDLDGIKNLTSIQKQFREIKILNSNRTLTWELAVSYINQSKYNKIHTGNEKLAEVSAIAGYTQKDFDILQKIYNYGKQRIFSSIPRIENSMGKYRYEMLRLDDPLTVAIGTLTNCCQELGNAAEMCMQHSMVDKNGRVFVVRDEVGNIISQSWVWRNKDVLCFDNIEVPDNMIGRAKKNDKINGVELLTDQIYKIYEKAAKELIDTDEKKYKQLLESGKITHEQYEGLRLGKVTVGLGYNDIAESIKKNSKKEDGLITKPLPFISPVKLSRGLYTSDSNEQYILEEREDRKKCDGETLAVHSDLFIEYDNNNFDSKLLLSLNKLELVTKKDSYYLNTFIDNSVEDNKIIFKLAKEYGFDPEKTRVVMNPNFAIIYEVTDEKIKIGDLLYSMTVDIDSEIIDITDKVVLQIRLALEQIADGKEMDISELDEEQKNIYRMVFGLNKELDLESISEKSK